MSDTTLICHALPDRDIARLLARLLEAAGLNATLGPAPGAGEKIADPIGEALAKANVAFVIVGTDASSANYRTEVVQLLDRAAAEPEFRLIPLLLPGAAVDNMPGLANFQAIDLRLDGGIVETLGKLAEALPVVGAVFLQAVRRRSDLVAGLLEGVARRWKAEHCDDRAEQLFELAASLLERATTPDDEPKTPLDEGQLVMYATVLDMGLDIVGAVANAAMGDEETSQDKGDSTVVSKALTARLGAWATEMLDRGNLAEARSAFERVLPLAKSAFGDDSRTTIELAAGLARSLRGLGELGQARIIEEETLARLRKRDGDDDATTLAVASNLAATLAAQGALAEARALQESVLATRRRVLGDSHPETLTAMSNLAGTLHALGDYESARTLREITLQSQRTIFGANQPETLAAAWNLLVSCLAMNDTEAAARLVETDLAPLLGADEGTLPSDLARLRNRLVHPVADVAANRKGMGAAR